MKTKILQIFFLLTSIIVFSQAPLYRFNFDNTYWNTSSTVQFIQSGSNGYTTYFQSGRNGGQAVKFPLGSSLSTSLNNLPLNASARSIAVWIKFDNVSSKNYIFSYGASSTGNCFGLTQNTSTQFEQYNWGGGYSVFGYLSANLNTTNWYHLVTVYDGTNVKIYINGVLLKSQAIAINTLNGYFKLGDTPSISSVSSLNAKIDDLQIYDFALTDVQIQNLYQYDNLLSTNENQIYKNQIYILPNPTKDFVFVKSEKQISKIELYDYSGKKLKESTSKEMNVSSLPKGNYIIKVTDKEGNTQTKNLIKE